MANYEIMTNNPDVRDAYPEVSAYAGYTVEALFKAVRDAVHLGAELISHPLSGSIKPNESPYKSVMVSLRRGPLDEASCAMIEDAIATLAKLPEKPHAYTERMMADFRVIDLDLMQSAMASLPASYHA